MSEGQTATTEKTEAPVAAATPTAPVTPPAPTTVASQAVATPVAQPSQPLAPADWPSDWRQKIAGADPEALKTIERFASPLDLWKSYTHARAKISAGETMVRLPENASPEQIAEYRKAIGIPEKPEDYKIELPNGLVFSEADKPLVESFKQAAHANNLDPKSVNQILAWYTDQQQITQSQRNDLDESNRAKVEEDLRREWGPEYKTADGQNGKNLNAIANLFSDAPEGLFDQILSARDAEGMLLGDNPNFIKWAASLGREIYPTATLIPFGADAAKGVLDRKAEIESLMGNSKSEYWKGPKADALQTEYRELIETIERHNKRAA